MTRSESIPRRSQALRLPQRIGLCCLGPVMVALSFPQTNWSFLTPFALTPMLWGTAGTGVLRSAMLGWLGGAIGYGVGWSWMFESIQVFQDAPASQAVIPFIAIQVYHGGQFGMFAALATWLRGERAWAPIAATTSSWGLLEWAYPKFGPWSMGDLTVEWPYIPQIVDLFGSAGVGFLIAATSVVTFNAIYDKTARSGRLLQASLIALVVAYLGAGVYGAFRVRQLEAEQAGARVEVAVLQAALPVGDPDPQRASAQSWNAYATRSRGRDLAGVDIVFWPETTIREYLRHGSQYTRKLSQLAIDLRADIVLGALDLPDSPPGEFSGVYVLSTDGPMQLAHKLRLLPFGEYIPGREWIPRLTSWQTTGEFLPGTQHPVLDASGMRLATSICFEALYPGFNNDDLRQGATLLVNLSDDSRFGDTDAPYMHLNAARWRAMEARRWLVRSSNSGVSAVIAPTGNIVASIPFGEAGAIRETVFAETALTPFVRWGQWFLLVEVVLLAIGGALRLRRPAARKI